MRKKNNSSTKAIIGLAAATVVVIGASVAISLTGKGSEVSNPNNPTPTVGGGEQGGSDNNNNTENKGTALDLAGAGEKIEAAYLNEDGTYTVVVNETGYVGAMKIEINYAADGQTVLGYKVLESSETPGIGSKVDEDAYKTLLAGTTLPIYANGMDISAILGAPVDEVLPEAPAELQDGVYEAVSEPASNGYVAHVTMTVEGGKIVAVTWDEEKEGNWKSVLSTQTPYGAGSYIMRPLWHQQSEKMCQYVIDNQSTTGLNLNEDGKTDVVSGVSIALTGFTSLVDEVLAEGKDGEFEKVGAKDDHSGYTPYITGKMEGGKITELKWNEEKNGEWKIDLSINGKYVMAPVWDTQAKSMGQYVVDNQGTAGLNLNDNGKTDVVSGVSINVAGFTALVEECIAKASGALQDGVYEVAAEPNDKGNYAFVTLTVEGGKITSVVWDEVYNGSKKSILSTTGQYVMKPVWQTQSEIMCKYVVDTQGTAGLELNEAGKPTVDAVAGVSINVLGFVELVDKAIADANGKDGVYEVAAEPNDKGNYAFVTLTIEGGKITNVVWDEVYNGSTKSELSTTGKYVMKPVWQTQSEIMGQYVVDTQGTAGLGINEAGKPTADAVAGVSINVTGFIDLVEKAIAQAKGTVTYADGVYEVKAEPNDKGNYAFVTLTIEGGKITSVVWDEVYNGSTKSELSTTGKYVMKPVWQTQSEIMCKYVVDTQGTAGLELNEAGKPTVDAVAGVSINVLGFVELVDKAIADANGKDGVYEVKAEPNDKGNYAFVTLTIEGGKITNVVWDEVYNGSTKSELSTTGKYVMKPVWQTQSEIMCQYVVDTQGTAGLGLGEDGKPTVDAVAGVSINVTGFIDLVHKALAEASSTGEVIDQPEAPAVEGGTLVEVVSGATFSSKAVIRAINEGYVFLRDCVIK